ncbi:MULTISPECIES: DNA alkylation repair protein [Chryseobacterium]|uniref:3-methyladenine DNA glycosylase AlkC n=1 Tax=Chryseobacterium camelliae TaxID=1265445 RepID=A0ABU0TIV8_9FLAO|nr:MULTISPECIES: DNA alkylation repair protein [Chryseobacterium]MDT3409384.1 3-methyladenine DNA glycosylase AlkC [Pseudacidovorax intermedius]MDQ1096751.1 3-methyladenine DNA glycosylase AlkC [Chryseobacterium camelliae]MDQ1100694.1 3-methyladenine DNA glycosylase AlkC [Chryseobacterium sp. SORGH_AS_1048]MDR6088033.1 3-methyladenine DNA glycosylase AlkC [Chryseobacterium sp. SORGH_AS_0909]MDR6132407.1 3-methyladenine DNA glycosylase AlkC [Chryseobacterium sp. SORGH_AS_1175]
MDEKIIDRIRQIEHGFKHIIAAGDQVLTDHQEQHFNLALQYLADDSYQVRMLAAYLLGQLSPNHPEALHILETRVADDRNWRVQEMLAKAFDDYCRSTGYEESLTVIKRWLSDPNPNVKRAVTEGLRIWTSRPYFREHPLIAIALISSNKSDDSEYLRKSIGNALHDISKKHPKEVSAELASWDVTDKKTAFTYQLAQRK